MFVLWQVIRDHPNSLQIYEKKLAEQGLLTADEIKKTEERVFQILQEEFESSKDYVPQTRDWLAAYWAGFKGPEQLSRIRNTG